MPGVCFCLFPGMSGQHPAVKRGRTEALCTSKRFSTGLLSCPVHLRAAPPHTGGGCSPSWRAPPPDPRQGLRALDHAGAGLRLRLSDSVKARTPGGLPSPAHLTPVRLGGEGRATAYGWATKPGALGKTRAGKADVREGVLVRVMRERIMRAHMLARPERLSKPFEPFWVVRTPA